MIDTFIIITGLYYIWVVLETISFEINPTKWYQWLPYWYWVSSIFLFIFQVLSVIWMVIVALIKKVKKDLGM